MQKQKKILSTRLNVSTLLTTVHLNGKGLNEWFAQLVFLLDLIYIYFTLVEMSPQVWGLPLFALLLYFQVCLLNFRLLSLALRRLPVLTKEKDRSEDS